MKKTITHLFLMLTLTMALASCNSNDEDYVVPFEGFGTVEVVGMTKYIKMDHFNKLALPLNFNGLGTMDEGTRLYFWYSLPDPQDESSSIMKINIEREVIMRIPSRDVNIADFGQNTAADTLGNGAFYNMSAYWVSGNYFTALYSYLGSNKSLTYMKFDTKGNTEPTDTIRLQLVRKEPENNPSLVQIETVVSFKLDHLREYAIARDSVVLAIEYKIAEPQGRDTISKEVFVTYKW